MSTAQKSKDNSGRRDPRISLNKLGEYAAESNPLRRHRIVYNQKHPDDFIVPYYDPVRDAIVRYIENSERDIRPLRDAIEKLRQNAPESKWKEQRFKSCLGAITSFRSQFGTILQQKKLRAKPVSKSDPTSIHVEGVRVSIRPDLLVCGKNGRGRKIAGAIKLHFSKNHPLNEVSGKYVATLLHRHVEEKLADQNVSASLKRCIVLDIFTGKRFTAPRSYKRRRQDLAAACLEIRTTWPQL